MEGGKEMKTKNINFKPALLLLIGFVVLISYGCTKVEDDSRSGSLLVVDSVNGLPGGAGETAGVPLLSDICDEDSLNPSVCTVFNDDAEIEFSNEFLQIGPGAGVGEPGFIADIIVNRYRVDYFRSNGRNTPGVDVPFAIDGTMNVRVPVDGNATATIVVVRHEAKKEPPLAELQFGPSEGTLTLNAQMQFFGHDIAGRTVSATGFLEIHFAAFAEPGATTTP
jgi:hypothetical protein